MAEKERVVWIDFAKGVAIIMVVFVHTDGTFLFGKSARFDSITWWYLNVVNTICRVCVPLFFMLSGVVVLGSPARSALDGAYVRRVCRVLIPLAVWGVIYLLFTRSGSGRWPTVMDVLGIARGRANYHLWFLYSIAGLYIISPMLNAYVCATGDKGSRRLGFLSLVIVGAAWTIERLYQFQIDSNLTRMLPVYTGYFVLGFAFRSLRPSLITKIVAAIVFVAGTAACAGLTRWILTANVPFDGVVGDYLNPMVMVMSIAMFLLLLPGPAPAPATVTPTPTPTDEVPADFPVEPPPRKKSSVGIPTRMMASLGRASFGVYLSHVMILETFLRFAMKENRLYFRSLPLMAVVPITGFVVIAISWALTAVMSRIPIVRRIV